MNINLTEGTSECFFVEKIFPFAGNRFENRGINAIEIVIEFVRIKGT